jgi:isoquinoline 1-oxidoreductase beta subunit
MRSVLRKAAEAAGWDDKLPAGWGKGVALSIMGQSYAAQIAEVEIVSGRLYVRRIVCAFDCGLQIDPDSIVSQLEGGIVFGLTAALFGAVTVADGQVVEGNFDSYRLVTLADMPKVEVHLVASDAPPSGVGEAGPPGVAPAVCNAIFAATGQRFRQLPIASSNIKV